MSDIHDVFAIRYGHHDRPAHENYIGGDPHDILQPLNYFVWVIRGAHGTFVMDTGFDHAMAAKRGRLIIKPVADGLRAIDVNPDEVRDVIISHMHYDHCGNHDLFPRARYHVQDREMMYSTGRFMCHAHQRIPFEVDDVAAMVRKVFADRVVFHEGDETLVPGVTLHHIGGHSMGLQCVRVKTARGHVVLAADATHLYAHIDEGRVFPVTYSVAETLEGYSTLKKLADSPGHIIPGHDPQVLTRYSAARRGLENWIVDLGREAK
jgi:glyoxylase-like metal-dependent hydrolase (beta-lactamase superfamily II)